MRRRGRGTQGRTSEHGGVASETATTTSTATPSTNATAPGHNWRHTGAMLAS